MSSLKAASTELSSSTTAASSSSSSSSLSNWRVSGICNKCDVSPFCHTVETTTTENESTTKTVTASWSPKQLSESMTFYNTLISCTDSYLAPLLKDALHCLEDAYRLYGHSSLIGSYNGGKDAVVIMHLMRAAHAKYYFDQQQQQQEEEQHDQSCPRPRVVYFDHPHEFPEVLDLLQQTVRDYDLDMLAFQQGIKFNQGLDFLVQSNYFSPIQKSNLHHHHRPHPMAFVLGTRSSDPNAGTQRHFAPSSSYMPPFMRINPIIDWTYGHVWHFLRLFQLPYCILYDQGYTSLGTIKDTLPCPLLAIPNKDQHDSIKYWPAYMLRDWDQERAGRIKKEPPLKKNNTSSSTSSSSSNTKEEGAGRGGGEEQNATLSQSSSSASFPSKLDSGASSQMTTTTDQHSSVPIPSTILPTSEAAFLPNSALAPSTKRTVGLIVIGDEILKGLTVDTNTHVAALALREQNIHLSRVAVVSDTLDDIVDEIHRMRLEVDIVITSGGVGPTHDDVTMKAVGAALNSELVFNEEMAMLLIEKMKDQTNVTSDDNNDDSNDDNDDILFSHLTEGQRKMATLPKGSELRYTTNTTTTKEWPILQVQNIFVLPGVPRFFETKIRSLATYISSSMMTEASTERSLTFKVVLSVDESTIVSILNTIVNLHEDVSIGSYPFVMMDHHPSTDCKTVVTLEGRQFEGGHLRNSGRFFRLHSEELIKNNNNMTTTTTMTTANRTFFRPKRFTKEQMDSNVKLAVADLVDRLPEGSILRVDNSDDLSNA